MEKTIIAHIGMYGCMIMANTSETKESVCFWAVMVFLWFAKIVYMDIKYN